MTDKTDSKERDVAEQWLRDRYGAYRGHFAWRELEEAFKAGRASLATSADGCQHESDGFTYTSIPPKNRCKKCGAVYTLGGPQAANAGSEPVAYAMFADNGNIRLWSKARIPHPDAKPLYLHPSPPAGMVGGWMPIETAPKYTEHGVRQHLMLGYAPDEIHEDGFVSQGYWMEAEEDAPDNMGHDGGWVDVHFDFFRCGRSFGAEAYRSAGTQPSHWMPLPPPPTSSADSRKGE
jgi:hypothetical protein